MEGLVRLARKAPTTRAHVTITRTTRFSLANIPSLCSFAFLAPCLRPRRPAVRCPPSALWFSAKPSRSEQQGPDDSCIHASSPLCCSAEVNIHSSSNDSSKFTMWNKLTSVLKARTDVDVPSEHIQTHPSRGTKSLDLQRVLPALPPHPVDSPQPLPAPSPPSSPSKYGRLGLFRRSSKSAKAEQHDNSSSVSLARKVKASLNINTNFNGE